MIKTTFSRSAIATALLTLSPSLLAAGFQINEHSASGLGRAFAGEGVIADSAAIGARNPAGMMLLDSANLSMGLSVIDPEIDAAIHKNPAGPTNKTLNDIAPIEFVPNFHYVHPMNDQWAWGVSAFSNFGLSTDFGKKIAGPIAGDTKLITMNLNLNGAYRINEQWSVGAGINGVYGTAELNRYDPFGAGINLSHMKGDGLDFGWNIGTLWQPNAHTRFSLTYRSAVDIQLEGEYKGTASQMQTVDGILMLNLPEIAEFSGYHQITPQWAMHYGVMFMGWERFKELKGTSPNGENIYLHKTENWQNSWRYAVGTTYQLNEKWTLRSGIAYDESPVPNDHKTLSIPDSDRTWYTLGTTYQMTPALSLDLGFAYLKGETSTQTEMESGFSYDFSAGGDAYLYSLQLNYQF